MPAWATTRTVGSGQTYATVRAAVQAAASGDSVTIYGGVYHSDHFTSSIPLHFKGYNSTGGQSPMPIFDGDSTNSGVDNSKGIFTFTNGSGGSTVDNIEFRNALNSSSNGSGIRVDPISGSITVQNCSLHNCQMEILGQPQTFLIQNCTIYASQHSDDAAGCGHTPPCFDHCIYINGNNCTSATIQYNKIYHADAGNEVKSRATNTWVLYNLIYDDTGQNTNDGGGPSYCIDIPDGGRAYVIGNTIVQSTTSANTAVWSYAAESANNGTLDLYAINNTIVNDQASGGNMIQLRSGTTAHIINNIMYGPGTTWTTSGVSVISSTNYDQPTQNNNTTHFTSPGAPAYDYRLTSLTPTTIVNAGVNPGVATGGYALTPTQEYSDPASSLARPVNGALDIGAFEYAPSSSGGNTTPVLTQPADMTCAEGSTCDQTVTATDANGDAITFTQLNVSPYLNTTVTTVTPGTGTGTGNIHLQPSYLDGDAPSGAYTLKLSATDPSLKHNSNTDKTINVTITNTDRAVILNQPSNMIVTEGTTATQTVAAFDPDYDTVTFSISSGPGWLTATKVNDQTVTVTASPTVGQAASSPFTGTLRASDGTLNTDLSFTVVVLPAAASDPTCTPF